jgi:subtilisin family serine protease/predicted SprT family Zn-dependent metalloprotease
MRANGFVHWLCFAALTSGLAAQAPSSAPRLAQASTRLVHERALEDPFDEERFRAYLAALPRDGEFYVVEGDLLKTMPEVRAYLAAQSQSQSRAGTRPELLVSLFEGRRDYYSAVSDRRLRYFVDRASFSSADGYERVLTAMRKASYEWQNACPECQIELSEIPAPPSGDDARTGFVVRQHDAGGAYIAAAFFPHDPPARRILRVDPSYFRTSFDAIGVLRHELGHVLGYRHEHTRGIPGCGFEDNQWQPLTPYDAHSVMHYFCGGAGSMDLYLSRVDVSGHRALYGGPSSTGALANPPGGGSRAAAEAMQRFEAAQRNAFDERARKEFLETLPKVGEYFIVEGDIKMTEAEVIAHLAATAASETPTQRTPELIVNLHRGRPDFYPAGARTLTYVVDRRSFDTAARYEQAAQAMVNATMEWEALCSECGIDFDYLKQFDDNPAAAKANFTVRLLDAGGEFIAAAFFPHDPAPRRLIDIDPSFYSTTFDKVGVLRHELGHVLGYRHEHIRGIAGCFREDNSWRPLTPYDPRSVMHYFCGGGGNMKLEISTTDRAGHHRLYEPPARSAAIVPPPVQPTAGVLVVSFEGGDVIGNAARTLGVLHEMKLLPVAKHTIAEGDQVGSVYESHMRLPAATLRMINLASNLNGVDYTKQPLVVGGTLVYPDVRFIQRSFGKFVDQKTASQIEQNWKHIVVDNGVKKDPSPTGYERVELRSYELRLPVKDMAQLQEARLRVGKLGPNVLAGVETSGTTAARYHSAPLRERALTAVAPPRAGEESVLVLSGLSRVVGKRACQGVECPEIVLLDKPLQVHPDLKGAIPDIEPNRELENEALIRDGKEIFDVINWHDTYHSTHLAGIIASRSNGFGVIGVDPDALVTWWNWDDLSAKLPTVAVEVAKRQRRARVSSGAFQIYMFATSWPTAAFGTFEDLIHEDGLSKRFNDEQPLVIAAAGEADPRRKQQPQSIHTKTTEAPMNQGDQSYVLVVTGCDPCVAPGAQLISQANFSSSFVHVAAPAADVLSTAWGAKYAEGDGTSQATAFVTGLASAMVARYPQIYKHASHVKARLQVTSTPIELVGNSRDDSKKLAAGIIDPGMATRDPRKHWLKSIGGDHHAFDNVKWDVETLTLTQVGGAQKTIPTGEIVRIATVNNKSVVYTVGEKDWIIHKIGPGVLSVADPTKSVVTLDTTPVMLGAIEDLLLTSAQSIR